jgi:hypothetical protein
MKTIRNLLLIIFFLSSISVLGQDKLEQEVRVKAQQVPLEARKWLKDAFESVRKPKWYKEFSELDYSFEAKFKLKGRFHSVEFDSLGNVLDVEIEIEWESLSEEVKANLTLYFEETLRRFKLEKIQIQYSGLPGDLEDFFDEEETDGVLIQFEIEYQAEDQSEVIRIWEGTFSSDGKFLTHRRIIVRELFNLFF